MKASLCLESELNLQPVISIASPQYRNIVKSLVKQYGTKQYQFHEGSSLELISKSSLSLVSSGTISLEHALLGVPHVVTYKFNPITYWVAQTFFKKTLAKIPFMSMPNMLLNKEVFPELLQENVNVDNCVKHGRDIFLNQSIQNESESLWNSLDNGVVADLAATTLLKLI